MNNQTNPKEEWKYIEGTNNKYLISNFGNVISLKWKRYYPLKLALKECGYYYAAIMINGKRKDFRVHRLVAKAFIANPNNYTDVNHIDGNKKNNRIDNLEWCTRSMNLYHYYHILGRKGHPQTEETKQRLRELWKGKLKNPETKRKLSESLKRYHKQKREQKRQNNGSTDNQTEPKQN